MAIPPIHSLEGAPQPDGKKGKKGRYRRNRHRKGQKSSTRPRSDSESEFSDTSGNSKDSDRHTSQLDESLFIALDCEMVGTGPRGKCSELARVTMVDWNHNVVLDEFVRPQQEVTDYRTFVSGITAEMLEEATALDLETCRQKVQKVLEEKILVGHGLKNDMRALGITHPWHLTRDTAKYPPFMRTRFEDGILWPRGLKELCKEKLDLDVQVDGRPHCPKEDAVAALDLYRLVQNKFEKAMAYKINKTRAIQQQQLAAKE